MRILFLFFIFLSFEFHSGIQLLAQSEAVDSLNRILNLTQDKDQRVKNLNLIAYELKDQDPVKSGAILEKALSLARELNDKEEIAFALITKGNLLENSDDFSLALNSYLEAIDLFRGLEKDVNIAELNYRIGSLYKTLGNYQKALEYCLDGLSIYEKTGDKNGIALIYRVMGSIYKYKGDYEKSLFYYSNGLRINEEINNQSGIANSYNNIGVVYVVMKDFEKALEYYRKSLQINISENIETEAAINLGNIGVVYLELNQLDSAYYYINKRHSIAIVLHDRKGIAISLEAVGNYYFKKKEYSKAIEYYANALHLSREIGILEITKSILKSLSDLYEEKSDFPNALSYHKSYINIRDSLLNRETVQRIEQMEMEYTYEKERSNHLISEEKNKLYIIIGFAALIFTSLFLILIYMNQNIKLKHKDLKQKNLEIEKQKLQHEVYFKDKELVSKAINLAEKNELINDISGRLKVVTSDPKSGSNEIKDIIKDLKFHSDTHLWDEFEYTFLQVHPQYFESLGKRFPELTSNERRLSAFLRLNLSTKEISNITHQSLHSLTVARTRLRKKLGIDHTGENLATFLSQF